MTCFCVWPRSQLRMTGIITWVVDCGDGVCIERSQAMNDFFRGLGSVCLGTLAGAGLGSASFFAIEAVLPKQADAAPAHTVTKALKHEPKLSARQTILEANRHLIANGWRPAPEKNANTGGTALVLCCARKPFGLLQHGRWLLPL